MARSSLKQPLGRSSKGQEPRRKKGYRTVPMFVSLATLVGFLLLSMIVWMTVFNSERPEDEDSAAVVKISGPESTGSLSVSQSTKNKNSVQETRVASSLIGRSISNFDQGKLLGSRPDLVELSSFGPLPVIGADGLRPMDAYAGQLDLHPTDTRPRIVLIVDGLGLSQTNTERAIKTLPSTVTLAFAPTGNSLSRWMEKARLKGHEILLQIPLEPSGRAPSLANPRTLLIEDDIETATDRLNWVLGRGTAYAGLVSHLGAAYLSDPKATEHLIEQLNKRGLYFLDATLSTNSVAQSIGSSLQAPVLSVMNRVDRNRTKLHILAELDALEQIAKNRGSAIGIASALPITLNVINEWLGDLDRRGLVAVPASKALAE